MYVKYFFDVADRDSKERINPNKILLVVFFCNLFGVWLAFYQRYALAARKLLAVFRLYSVCCFFFAALLSCVLCSEWNRFRPFQPSITRNGEESAHAHGFQSIEMKTGKPTNKTPTTQQRMHTAPALHRRQENE